MLYILRCGLSLTIKKKSGYSLLAFFITFLKLKRRSLQVTEVFLLHEEQSPKIKKENKQRSLFLS